MSYLFKQVGPLRVDEVGDMTIEWDVPIEIDDRNMLRADVFASQRISNYVNIAHADDYWPFESRTSGF